jgi:hypothetical protein
MLKLKLKIKLLSIIVIAFLFVSCFEANFEILHPDKPSHIQLEEKHEKKLFGTSPEFDLRITNISDKDFKKCELIFDDKFHHTLLGLHTRDKGMIKDSVFRKGEQYIIFFGKEDSNFEFYNVDENLIHPAKITIKCDECEINWNTD